MSKLFFLFLGMGLWFIGFYLYKRIVDQKSKQRLRPLSKPMTEREIAIFLFGLLDDIDTVSDIAKGNDKAYRKMVERIQNRRWETGMTTDGYRVFMPGEEPEKPVQEMIEAPADLQAVSIETAEEADATANGNDGKIEHKH